MRASPLHSQNDIGEPLARNGEDSPGKDLIPDSVVRRPERQQSRVLSVAWETNNDWLVWQIADSAFPTGGFAHSGGLEAAWQQGEVRSSEELVHFIQAQLTQAGKASLPFVNETFHELRPFAELDLLCDAFLSNHVAKRGSRSQGQAFLLAAAHASPSTRLQSFRTNLHTNKLPGHFAPVFGATLHSLEVSHSVSARLFLFMSLRTLLTSAVRLGITGPMAAQLLQRKLAPHAEAVAVDCSNLSVADITNTSPLLDILQGVHDRLYSRLFQT
jgi:urease accessory protein